jgi:alpha-tubulin suppressor-like RCC1 family protein
MIFFKQNTCFLLLFIAITGCSQGGSSSGGNSDPTSPPSNTSSNPPINVKFLTSNQSVIAKSCSSVVSLETIDINNIQSNVTTTTVFTLSGIGLNFFSDSSCSNAISSVTLSTGKSITSFYVSAQNTGTFIISATEPTFGQIYQQIGSVIGPASKIAIITEPQGTFAGQLLSSFSVRLEDAYGNNVSESGSAISISTTPSASMNGTTTVNTISGIAQFNNIIISKANNYTITFSSPGIISATSSLFSINANSAVGLSFLTIPTSGVVGQQFSPAITVGAIDQYGNVDTLLNSNPEVVTVAAYSDSTCLTVKGLVSANQATIVNGIANFSSNTDQFGITYFKASSPSFGQICSGSTYVYSQLSTLATSESIDSGSTYDVGNLIKGGVAPYSYSIQSTIGSSINEIGFFTAGTNTSSSSIPEQITITDQRNQTISLTVNVFPQISLNFNPSMAANSEQTLSPSGGVAPYSYAISSGTGSINSSGTLIAPAASGLITVKVTDSSDSSKLFNISVTAALSASAPIYSLSTHSVNQLTQTITTLGGTPPYTYSIYSGLGSVSSSGIFQASTTPGVTIVKISDSGSESVQLTFDITSGGATHLVFSNQPGNGTIGQNLTALPIVLALNDDPDVDYAFGGNPTIELYDSGCNNKNTDQSLTFLPNVFSSGRFQPELLEINTAGTFSLKISIGNFTACSNTFTISNQNSKIIVGKNNICQITNGVLKCLGANDDSQLTSSNTNPYSSTLISIASSGLVTDVAVGPTHICDIDDGELKCWGSNQYGQLGSAPSSQFVTTPSLINSISTNAYGISLGDEHSCAVMGSNLNCWGNDAEHQLGRGSPVSGFVLNCFNISDQTTCQDLGCSLTDSCTGFTTSDSCATNNQCNFNFSTGVCSSASSEYSCQGNTSYSCESVASQNDCSNAGCQWSNGSCYTPGSNFTSSGYGLEPVIGFSGNVFQTTSSHNSNCSVVENEAFCWGDNTYLQTASTGVRVDKATKVDSLENVTAITIGLSHGCALNNGDVYCWGANDFGQLGTGIISNSPNATPQLVNLSNIIKVVAGDDFTCALSNAQSVYCWGTNNLNQLGIGTSDSYKTSPVAIFSGAIDISASGSSACLLNTSNALYCWGFNNFGHADSVNYINYSTPTLITQ